MNGNAAATQRTCYLLIARHGAWEHSPFLRDAVQRLTSAGASQVRDVAKTFAEHVHLLPPSQAIHIGQIWHSEPTYARQTAELFASEIRVVGCSEIAVPPLTQKACLNPEAFWK